MLSKLVVVAMRRGGVGKNGSRGHRSLQCCDSASSVLAVGVSRLPNCALLKSQASEQRRKNARQGQGETGLADPEWGGPFPP